MTEGRHPTNGQFLPGFSGNPGGSFKGRRITSELESLLQEEAGRTGKTNAQLLAVAMLKHALAGKPHYMQMVLDRIEGKVPDVVFSKGIDDMSTEEIAEALRGVADAIDDPKPPEA